jgi:hypothetical protein
MSWIEIICWRQTYDPREFMSVLQCMIVESALMRGDTKTAKQHMIDWKIIR